MSDGERLRHEEHAVELQDATLDLRMSELTLKQMLVIELVAKGLSNRQIAAELAGQRKARSNAMSWPFSASSNAGRTTHDRGAHGASGCMSSRVRPT